MSSSPGLLPEDRYRAIVEAQTEMILLAKPDGSLVYVNPACARQFGVEPEQMVGRHLLDHVAEADRATVRHVIDEVMASGSTRSVEHRIVDQSGQPRWTAWTHGVQREGSGCLLRSVGHDVPERRAQELEAQGSGAFLQSVTDSLPMRIAYVGRDLRYRFANLAHCQRFGRRREDVIGRTREELLGVPTPGPISARIEAVLAGQAQRFEYDEMTGGVKRHYEVQLVPDTGPDGRVRGYFYTGLDVTDRTRAEQAGQALAREAQRQSDILRLVAEAIPATVVVVGADNRYRFVNSAFEAYCGLPREQIIGRTAVEVLGAAEVDRRRPFMAKALSGQSVSFTLDYPGLDGTTWLELSCIPLRLNGGGVDGFVGVSQDVTRQRREQDRLTELSQRDPLTGLLNRAGFELCVDRLNQEGRGAGLGLLYIDLDRFKPVNDAHGHLVGDRLLQLVAQRLGGLVRPTDAVARLGGDEFAILLVDVGAPAHAEVVAGKVVAALGAPFQVDGLALRIGASVGVAFGAEPAHGWREMVQRADGLLYRAKAEGRGRYASNVVPPRPVGTD